MWVRELWSCDRERMWVHELWSCDHERMWVHEWRNCDHVRMWVHEWRSCDHVRMWADATLRMTTRAPMARAWCDGDPASPTGGSLG